MGALQRLSVATAAPHPAIRDRLLSSTWAPMDGMGYRRLVRAGRMARRLLHALALARLRAGRVRYSCLPEVQRYRESRSERLTAPERPEAPDLVSEPRSTILCVFYARRNLSTARGAGLLHV